jgi:hypothetical protein
MEDEEIDSDIAEDIDMEEVDKGGLDKKGKSIQNDPFFQA